MNKIKAACFAILLSTVFALAPAKADQEPITVFHFFVKGCAGPSGAFWKAADQYQEQNPDARLDFEFVDSSTYSETLNIMMAGNELPDIWLTKADILPTLADEGLIQAAGPRVQEDPAWAQEYKEDVFLDSTYKDVVWGVPYQIQPNCIGFYNASIFEKCGIDHWPETMQELIRDCEKIREAGYTPIALGNKDHIMFPVCRPVMTTIAILTFMHTWNEFPFARVLILKDALKTIPIGLTYFTSQYTTDYTLLFAALAMATLPLLVLYLFCYRNVMKGMMAGAVKG